MKPKNIVSALSQLVGGLSKSQIALITIVLGLVIAGAIWLYKSYKKRQEEKKAGPDVSAAQGQSAQTPDIDSDELRKAWKRSIDKMPSEYKRSILNFEHFIVMGTQSSDPEKIIDTQTDARHQMKQVMGSGDADAELPVYLAGGAVIMVLPERYLYDSSEKSKAALDQLWRPLYKQKSPTVVVSLDLPWLMDSTPDVVAELARSARSKINQLSAIRGKPIDVRVALTRMDAMDGFAETAAFWGNEGISSRIQLAETGKMRPSLDEWEVETEAQLPRALKKVSADDYRRVITFVRKTATFLSPLEQFLETLFAAETMSKTPTRGGAYLLSEAQGSSNPLRGARDASLGPDPRRRHLVIAAATASAMVTYFLVAYQAQYEAWEPAADAMATYDAAPDRIDTEHEQAQRRAISEFTVDKTGFLYRFPGFFSSARQRMKDEMSAHLRDELLIPRLRDVAQNGIVGPDSMTLRWRRAIYYLGLIHSFEADRLGIRKERDLWSSMTGLSGQVIEDYLANTDAPYKTAVKFDLGYQESDERDSAAYWVKLPRGVQNAMADGYLRPEELSEMQRLAKEMSTSLSRFEHDDRTLAILENIDLAADGKGERNESNIAKLHDAYYPTFEPIVKSIESADLQRQVGQLRRLIDLIRASEIEEGTVTLLAQLTDRLSTLGAVTPSGAGAEAIKIKLTGQEYTIELEEWNTLLQNSRGALLIDRFVAGASGGSSIFFAHYMDAELRNVEWNPLATEGSIFRGRAVMTGRYTKVAYERYVKRQIERLLDQLAKMRVPEDHETKLLSMIRDEVRRYAEKYRLEASRFLRSYSLYAPSAEALRVALGQIASERSTFDDFVNALDENTDIVEETGAKEDEPKKADDPKKTEDPKKAEEPKTGEEPKGTDGPAKEEEPQNTRDYHAEEDRILQPIYDSLSSFIPWHNAVGASKGAPELGKYKEIVKQLLSDLTAAEGDAAGADGADSEGSTLEKELTPAGRVMLASIRGDKGSYDQLVREWIAGAGLTGDQQAPFMAPFNELAKIGYRDIETVVARAWNRDMSPRVKEISGKFPFERTAEKSALPDEISALFHPTDGKLWELFRSYVEPISAFGDGKPFRLLPRARGRVRVPSDLYPTINAAASLSAQLWDDKGVPKQLSVRVATVPFDTGSSGKLVPTVIYLNVGETSIFNFNQKPGASNVSIDWTKDEGAQVGIQVTDVETKETTFPSPFVASGPYWRFYRLLVAGKSSPVKQPADSMLYEWELRLRDGGSDRARARIVVVGDPWKVFWLPHSTGAKRASR